MLELMANKKFQTGDFFYLQGGQAFFVAFLS